MSEALAERILNYAFMVARGEGLQDASAEDVAQRVVLELLKDEAYGDPCRDLAKLSRTITKREARAWQHGKRRVYLLTTEQLDGYEE